MGRIPEEVVAEVLERTDMLQVVGEYVQLKRAGTSYKGLCPFHAEKTPSFNVSPDKGFFKCFGCGEGGSLYTFLMKLEGWTFPEAVRHLAARVGIEVAEQDDEYARDRKAKKEAYLEVTKLAQAFFERQLWEGGDEAPRRYLIERGVDEETARAFGLGWAPDGWSGLLDHLKSQRITAQTAEEAGLVIPSSRGGYDRFRARVMFPVFDIWGNPLAFSGRVIEEDPNRPGGKYINSPETAFYTKGRELFGLYTTKGGVRSLGAAMLVEGNFDVVTLYARGVTNVVAPLGTALTSRQVRLLARYCRKVHVAFDADKAGVAATMKALPALLEHDFDARVVHLPKGDDPDSYVRKEGRSALVDKLDHAQPIVEFAIDQLFEGKGGSEVIEERVRTLEEAGELLGHVTDRIAFNHYASEIARRLDIDPKAIRGYLKQPERARDDTPKQTSATLSFAPVDAGSDEVEEPPPPPDDRVGIEEEGHRFDMRQTAAVPDGGDVPFEALSDDGAGPSVTRGPIPRFEADCLQVLMDSLDKLTEFVDNGCCPLLTDERLVFLIERVYEQHRLTGRPPEYVLIAETLANELGDVDFFDQISTILCAERGYTEETLEKNYFDLVTRLQQEWLERQYEDVHAQIVQAQKVHDVDRQLELALQLRELNALRPQIDLRYQKKQMGSSHTRKTTRTRRNLEDFDDGTPPGEPSGGGSSSEIAS